MDFGFFAFGSSWSSICGLAPRRSGCSWPPRVCSRSSPRPPRPAGQVGHRRPLRPAPPHRRPPSALGPSVPVFRLSGRGRPGRRSLRVRPDHGSGGWPAPTEVSQPRRGPGSAHCFSSVTADQERPGSSVRSWRKRPRRATPPGRSVGKPTHPETPRGGLISAVTPGPGKVRCPDRPGSAPGSPGRSNPVEDHPVTESMMTR
jgi:hypothetical protein